MPEPLRCVLVSPYEIGRQPFGLAQATAWLRRDGHAVECLDLAVDPLDPARLAGADMIAVHLAMHTATRLALAALPRIRAAAPGARLCAFGLYAPPNAGLLRAEGFAAVLGGECEPALADLARRAAAGEPWPDEGPRVSLERIGFLPPDRSALPPLERYAKLRLADGAERPTGFVEASRGCRHRCRHCPVVPVYGGRFRVVPAEVVLADARAQVAAGARHLSFGDPDFLCGPGHARRVVEALHAELPGVTYDCTIKIEHLLRYREMLPLLARTGCVLVTTAAESVEDEVLERLEKGHTAEDLARAVELTRAAGIALAPTFVPFTPWTTLEGYRDLLARLVELELVEAVAPVQLAIRLLVPAGSRLLELADFRARVGDFDPALLGHPWHHEDPRVDALQAEVQAIAEAAEAREAPRAEAFSEMWAAAHRALGVAAPGLPERLGVPGPRHSEPWYCCAEPTRAQMAGL